MGKNFSCNNLGQRKASDFYETPYSLTRQLLEVEGGVIKQFGSILEPSSGDGAIVRVLKEYGLPNVVAKDIQIGQDFLLESDKFDAIITNPPFSLAFEFIQKAKQVSEYFALLLPLSYLHGKKRFDQIYSDADFPLSRVYVFTRYPMLGEQIREDGKYHTGMMVYAWFIWDKSQKGQEPVVRWLDNNKYVLSKKDVSE